MVNAHTSTPVVEPQIFSINNIQDAFDLFNRGFQVYNNVATGQHPGTPQNSTTSPTAATVPTAVAGQKRTRSYQPDVDIYESTDAVLVEVALPGVDKSGIEIEYDSKANRILLSGTSKRTHGGSEQGTEGTTEVKVIRTERPVGRFERIIGLGQQVVHSDQINAEYRDGILHLTVPKNKEAETKRKISIL